MLSTTMPDQRHLPPAPALHQHTSPPPPTACACLYL